MPHHRTAIRHRVRAVGAALGLVSVVTLGGCAGQEPVEPPPLAAPTTASPSATPTPSPSGPPTLPPEARGTSDKAAIAFVRHWIDLVNYAGDTLESQPLKQLSLRSCSGCSGLTTAVEKLRVNNGRIEDHEWSVRSTEVVSRSADLVQVRVLIDVSPSRTYPTGDASPERFTGGRYVYVFDLRPKDGRLRVAEVRQ